MIHVGRKKAEEYDGLAVKADPGLHGQVAAVVQRYCGTGSRILDLGAGEGALSARLRDLGYRVTAVDVDRSSFACTDVDFEQVDFDDGGQFEAFVARNEASFDAVLGIEVIEHVEDPWQYVRQLMKVVHPGGLLVITTPHITSWLSRFLFFFTGKFSSFDEHGLEYGHINPISPWELRLILDRCGAVDIQIGEAGTLPPLYLVPTREVLINLAVLPFRPLMRGLLDGWCIMAVARRP